MRPLTTPSLVLALTVVATQGFSQDQTAFHAPFDAVLKSAVEDGVVNYDVIAGDSRFADYVRSLEAPIPDGLNRAERLTYWINAYNALSIQGILNGHSPKSLLGRWKFFKRIEYSVGGRDIDLFDLERKVIIPIGEPRIHFAIVCASFSCPPLRAEAFDADRLDMQLDEQARTFLNDDEKNRYDVERGVAHISKIFDWYEDEFVAAAGSVQEYISGYVTDSPAQAALKNKQFKTKIQKYDWSLNGIPPKR